MTLQSEQILSDIKAYGSDWHGAFLHIMEYGERIDMADKGSIKDSRISRCQSETYFKVVRDGSKLTCLFWTDSRVIRGYLAMIKTISEAAEQIDQTTFNLFKSDTMMALISPKQIAGIEQVIERITEPEANH